MANEVGNRVIVLGPAGAGKSELASRLADRAGLPVVHLVPLFWRAGWQLRHAQKRWPR